MHNVQIPYIKPDRVCSIMYQPNPSPTYLELHKTESYFQFTYSPPASIEVIYVISFLPKNVRRIWHKLRVYLSFPHSTNYGSRSGGLGSPGDSVFFKTSWQMGNSWRVGGVVLHTSMTVEAHQFLKQSCCWCLGGVPTYYRLGLHIQWSWMISRSKIFELWFIAISPFLGPVMP